MEREIAGDEEQGVVGSRAGAERARNDAVDPVRPAVREHADAPGVLGHEGVQVSDRHAVSDVEGPGFGERVQQHRENLSLTKSPSVLKMTSDRGARRMLRPLEYAAPAWKRIRRSIERFRQGLGEGCRVGGHDLPRPARGASPAGSRIHDHMSRGGMPGRVRVKRFRRERSAELDHELGAVPLGERRGPKKRVVGAEDRLSGAGAESGLGCGVGENGIAGDLGEPRHSGRELGRGIVRAAHDEPAFQAPRGLGDALDGALRRRMGLHHHLSAGRRGGGRRNRIRFGKKRLPKHEVQVHGPRGGAPRLGDRAGPEGGDVVEHRGGALGRPHLREPPHLAPEELDLVDRLRGARVTKLRRAIGRGDDQRHTRVVRLDDRGKEVRGGGARRAHERDGASRGLGQTKPEETRRTLVERDVRRDRGTVEREREGCGPGTGADDRVPHSRIVEPGGETVRPRELNRAPCTGRIVRLGGRSGGVRGTHPFAGRHRFSRARRHRESLSS